MSESIRLPFWVWLALVTLAAAVLALAWWDWTYPGLAWMWWQGERIYPFFWRQLRSALLICGGVCLGLWGLSSLVPWATHAHPHQRASPGRAALPFLLALLALPFFGRYTFHPLGVQPGSSVWTYGLVAVTAGVLAFPLAGLARLVCTPLSRRGWGWAVVCVLAALYALVFGFLSVARHTSFRTHALDLGTMDQAAWNTIHGRILERTPLYRAPAEGTRYENRLLDAKLELAFIALSALYWLWPDPRILLIVQTLFLAAGVIPLYQLVVARTSSAGREQATLPAVLLAAAYLLYLPLHYVNMADFHPSALMTPLLIAAWRAMRLGRWRRYYLWLALAMSCRIDAAFAALALGAVIAVWPMSARQPEGARRRKGQRRHGIYTVALAIAWLAVDFGLVVPLVRRFYGPGAGDLVLRRFGVLGDNPLEMIRTLIARPGSVLIQFADRDKLQVIVDLLAPSGFVSLLGPLALLPALPVLAINLLAESVWQHSVHAHYMAPVIPFVWIATAEGVARLSKKRGPGWSATLATFALICSAGVCVVLSPFPPGMDFRMANYRQPSSHEEDLQATIALVPEGATVCAQSDIHPHLSQRRDACLYPRCQLGEGEEAEYVVLDLDTTATKSPLDYHAFYELVDVWLSREAYGVVAQRGGVVLLQRGAPRENIPDILAALDTYGRDFYRVDYVQAKLPGRLEANDLYRVPVTLRNAGSQAWHSREQLPVRLSYRWWTSGGALLLVDPLRTNLPHRVEPGQEVRLHAWLRTPMEPGRYILEWDMVREGDAWFGDMGATMLRQVLTIR